MEQINERNVTLSWSTFIASMFIGMGIGIFLGQAGAGTLIGMGVGYIAELVIGGIKSDHSSRYQQPAV
jgi:hypothetical protein